MNLDKLYEKYKDNFSECDHVFKLIYTTVSGDEDVYQCYCGAGMVHNKRTKEYY